MTAAEKIHRHSDYESKRLGILQLIESADSDQKRDEVIRTIALDNDSNASRILIDIYHQVFWRDTQMLVIESLGKLPNQRSLHFLIALALDRCDLAKAAGAIRALGNMQSNMAFDFLDSRLADDSYPLSMECNTSLEELSKFSPSHWKPKVTNPSPITLLCLAKLGGPENWAFVESAIKYWQSKRGEANLVTSLLAASQIGGKRALNLIENLDCHNYPSLRALKPYLIKSVSERLKISIEDIVVSLTDFYQSTGETQALLLEEQLNNLRMLPKGKTFQQIVEWHHIDQPEACQLPVSIQCWIRSQLHIIERADDDFKFLMKYFDAIDHDPKTVLLKNLILSKGADYVLSQLHNTRIILFLVNNIFTYDLLQALSKKIEDGQLSFQEKDWIDLTNGIVNQVLLSGKSAQTIAQASQLLKELSRQASSHITEKKQLKSLDLRIIRAFGQIGYRDEKLIKKALKAIHSTTEATPSWLSYLSQIDPYAAATSCIGEINILLKSEITTQNELDQANLQMFMEHLNNTLMTMSESERICLDPIDLPVKNKAAWVEKSENLWLSLSTKIKIHRIEEHLLSWLSATSFHTKITAMNGCYINHDETILEAIFNLIESDNKIIRLRAIDLVCKIPKGKFQRRLLKWISEQSLSENLVNSICLKLNPEPKSSYQSCSKFLKSLIEKQAESWSNPETIERVSSLYDRLVEDPSGRNDSKVTDEYESLNIDKTLVEMLPHFIKYPETIKASLRNAELTFHSVEFAKHQVDKSTIIVQYAKSIDLLLESYFGKQIMENQIKLQNRVYQLELDSKSVNDETMFDILAIRPSQFAYQFPFHKLHSLSQDISSGRFFQYIGNKMDGLRTWVIILLLFGRSFKSNTQILDPILDIKYLNTENLANLCHQMNEIQIIRNKAAHRGTLILLSEAEIIRNKCIGILRAISGNQNAANH